MDTEEFVNKLEDAWDSLDFDYRTGRLNLREEEYGFTSLVEYLNSLPAGDALYLFTQRFPHKRKL